VFSGALRRWMCLTVPTLVSLLGMPQRVSLGLVLQIGASQLTKGMSIRDFGSQAQEFAYLYHRTQRKHGSTASHLSIR